MKMFKFIKILLVFPLLVMVGCTSVKTGPSYNHPSPSIERMKDSGFEPGYKRNPDSTRYSPQTTLGAAVRQAGEVVVTVTFDFERSRNGREPRTGNCMLHIKSSDTSLSDVQRCRIQPSGGTFIVYFRGKNRQEHSFDLNALGGNFIGSRPAYYPGVFYITLNSHLRSNYRYVYVGKDPFNLK